MSIKQVQGQHSLGRPWHHYPNVAAISGGGGGGGNQRLTEDGQTRITEDGQDRDAES